MEKLIKTLTNHLEALRQDLLKDAEMPDATDSEKIRSMATAYGINISLEEIKSQLINDLETSKQSSDLMLYRVTGSCGQFKAVRYIREISAKQAVKLFMDLEGDDGYHKEIRCEEIIRVIEIV